MKVIKKCEVDINRKKWFPADNINFLCLQREDKVICKKILPDSDKKSNLYNAVYEYHGNIFLVPWRARQILVFCIQTSQFIVLENDLLRKWREEENKYTASLMLDHYLYLFGSRIPYIVKIDMDTCDIQILNCISGEAETLEEIIKPKEGLYFASNYVVCNSSIWIPMVGKMAIMELQIESGKMQIHEFPMGCNYTICDVDKRTYWIYVTKQRCIIKWSLDKGIIEKFDDIDLKIEENDAITLEYCANVIKCKSSKKCISINVISGQRRIEKIEDTREILVCSECDEEAAIEYLNLTESDLFMENSLDFLGVPCHMYIKYVKGESQMKYRDKINSCGRNIYLKLWEG